MSDELFRELTFNLEILADPASFNGVLCQTGIQFVRLLLTFFDADVFLTEDALKVGGSGEE